MRMRDGAVENPLRPAPRPGPESLPLSGNRTGPPGRTTRFDACLDCGKPLNAVGVVDQDPERFAPEPGDVAICFHCGRLMAYANAGGGFRPLTDEEIVEVAGDPVIVKAQNALGRVRAARRGR